MDQLCDQGRTYHWGLGGQGPPPIGLALHQTVGKLKYDDISIDDSVETPKFKKLFCKIWKLRP